jgi:hypothetical protein
MRWRVLTAAVCAACGSCGHRSEDPAPHDRAPPPAPAWTHEGTAPPYQLLPDAGTAIRQIIAADHPRVIGFGELHARTDRVQAESSLAHFTADVLPQIDDQLSDLVLETWVVDPKCGEGAKTATAAVEGAMRRPASTKSELAVLVAAARTSGVQPRAMHLGCDDYAKVAPPGGEIQIEIMLDLITRQLGTIASDAVAARDRDAKARPIVATYGGALHNDLYPAQGVEGWSFAAKVNDATHGRYVEIDLYVPEFAADDPASQHEPWFPLLSHAAKDHVVVIQRGARSYIVLLPKSS